MSVYIASIARTIGMAAHGAVGQLRKYTYEPYHRHPDRVASILIKKGFDLRVAAAAYLHDVVEDTHMTYELIAEMLGNGGEEVAALVREVTKISTPSCGNRKERRNIDEEHYAKASYEGQSIKVADILDNTRDVVMMDPKFAQVYLRENLKLLGALDKAHSGLRAEAVAQCLRGLRELGVNDVE